MISPRDPEYAEARDYKEGRRQLLPPFSTVADWIAEEFAVPRPLQVRLDHPFTHVPRPEYRLAVVLDLQDEVEFFRDGGLNFDKHKQAMVGDRFLDALQSYHAKRTGFLDHLRTPRSKPAPTPEEVLEQGYFVIFSSFERVAREEANSAISEKEIKQLQKQLAPLGIWKVYPLFASVTFMFTTDAQARQAPTNGSYDCCREAYWQLLEPHDRYGYYAQRPISDRCDSKQTFERDYDGSWFAYTR